ncbi:hypothetical protein ACOSQ3_010277 [Xanthoceras sorbifolium]
MNSMLEARFTAEEVRVALKQMAPLKTPGPDDLLALFYQRFWGIVGLKVSRAVHAVLNDRAKMRKMGKTYVVLIPKGSF